MAIVKSKRLAVARQTVRRVASGARRVSRRAVQTVVRVVRAPAVRRVVRKTALATKKAASVTAMAQARGVPAAVAGYLVAYLERKFRERWAKKVAKGEKADFFDDPRYRLGLMAFAVAFLTSSSAAGSLRSLISKGAEGAIGAIAALYEIYSSKSESNPVDKYIDEVKGGANGIS